MGLLWDLGGAFGGPLGAFGRLFVCFGCLSGSPWSPLGVFGCLLGNVWVHLGASKTSLGASGASRAPSRRLAAAIRSIKLSAVAFPWS